MIKKRELDDGGRIEECILSSGRNKINDSQNELSNEMTVINETEKYFLAVILVLPKHKSLLRN